jgi:hypothetical protein
MKGRYFLASFFGALAGACCVLAVVYVTNTKALVIDDSSVDATMSAIHTRINDFYIFAGIVITLLLAINVGVFIRAEDEVDKHIRGNFEAYRKKIEAIHDECKALLKDMRKNISNNKSHSNEN